MTPDEELELARHKNELVHRRLHRPQPGAVALAGDIIQLLPPTQGHPPFEQCSCVTCTAKKLAKEILRIEYEAANCDQQPAFASNRPGHGGAK